MSLAKAGEAATAIVDDDPLAELHAIAAGLRAWVEWEVDTGAIELPADPTTAHIAAPAPSSRTRAAPASSARAGPATPAPATPAPARARASAPAARAPTRPSSTPISVGPSSDALRVVRTDLGECQRCRLSADRKHIVFGVGNPHAQLVLVGEAPGQQEDATGEPFVGRSGQLLTRMLAALGLERPDVYICNVIKCRPPQNRDPMHDEVATCSPFLHRQLAAIAPRVIVTLGRFAGVNLIGREASMGDLRKETGAFRGIPVVATYHPSYLLRTPIAKRAAWDDLLRVRALLGR